MKELLVVFLAWVALMALPVPLQANPAAAPVDMDSGTSPGSREQVSLLLQLADENQSRSIEDAVAYAEKAVQVARELDDPELLALALAQLGRCRTARGDYQDALEIFRRCEKLERNRGNDKGVAYALNRIGYVLTDLSRYDEALDYYDRAIAMARKLGDRKTEASCLNEQGVVHWFKGDVDSALPAFRAAYRLMAELGDRQNSAQVGINIGMLMQEMKQYDRAIEEYSRALDIFRSLNQLEGSGTAYLNLCSAYREMNDSDSARVAAEKALDVLQQAGDLPGIAEANANLGRILHDLGDTDSGMVRLEQALATYRELGSKSGEADALAGLGELYAARGNSTEAISRLEQALDILTGIDAKREAADVSWDLAALYEETGQVEKALTVTRTYIQYNRERESSLERLKLKYREELDRREAEIRELNRRRELMLRLVLLAFLGIALIVLWLLFRLFRGKAKANAQLSTLNERLRSLSRTDGLTGLPNRRSMMDALEAEHQRFQRSASPFSVLMVDIDHFKQVNDRYGHDAGDAVLTEVARVFLENCRQTDTVCRWGGEEFLFLLRDTESSGAGVVAEKIRQSVVDLVVRAGNQELSVTVTVGVSCNSDEPDSMDRLISNADQALYSGKERGRNRVVLWSPDMAQAQKKRPGKPERLFDSRRK